MRNWLKRKAAPLLRIGLGVYAGLGIVLYVLQDSLIFHPQALPDGVRRVTAELPNTSEVALTASDGTRINGWLRHTQTSNPVGLVIYFGGNAEEVSGQISDAAHLAPWSVASFNYRGYGESQGKPSETALNSDALEIYDQLAARKDVDVKRIVVMGRSLGTGVAVHVAANRPVRAVMLVSPFDSLRSIAQREYPYVPIGWLLKHPFDSAALAPQIKAPLLVLSGGRDRLIPSANSKRLVDAWAGPSQWQTIVGTGHNDIQTGARYWPRMREFLTGLKVPAQ